MKNALERLKELKEATTDYPSVVPLIGAVLDLEARIGQLEQSKQDKSCISNEAVPARELSRGSLQQKMYQLLSTAGEREPEIALQLYRFLQTLS